MADVVLVHGLWYRSWSLAALKKRLSAAGHCIHSFNYPTLRQDSARNARSLSEFCRRRCSGEIRFIGHSLGGLVVLTMLDLDQELQAGRVVLLGAPVNGSQVAQRLCGTNFGRKLLGRSGSALSTGTAANVSGMECGMIAGTLSRGLGRLTGALEGPNDGTVRVAETHSDQFSDRIELRVSHTGLLFSAEVARQAAHFLETGQFQHGI